MQTHYTHYTHIKHRHTLNTKSPQLTQQSYPVHLFISSKKQRCFLQVIPHFCLQPYQSKRTSVKKMAARRFLSGSIIRSHWIPFSPMILLPLQNFSCVISTIVALQPQIPDACVTKKNRIRGCILRRPRCIRNLIGLARR